MQEKNAHVLKSHYLTFFHIKEKVEIWKEDKIYASSQRTVLLKEIGGFGHDPIYYFPRNDVCLDLLEKTMRQTFCYLKGDAEYWRPLKEEGPALSKDPIWSYPNPIQGAVLLTKLMAFDPKYFEIKIIDLGGRGNVKML